MCLHVPIEQKFHVKGFRTGGTTIRSCMGGQMEMHFDFIRAYGTTEDALNEAVSGWVASTVCRSVRRRAVIMMMVLLVVVLLLLRRWRMCCWRPMTGAYVLPEISIRLEGISAGGASQHGRFDGVRNGKVYLLKKS